MHKSELRMAALKAARDIVTTAQKASRGLTPSEKAAIDGHLAEADRLEAEIKAANEDQALLARLGNLTGEVKSGGEPVAPGFSADPAAQLERIIASKSTGSVTFQKADLTRQAVTGTPLQPGVDPKPIEIPNSALAFTDLSSLLTPKQVDNPSQVFYQVSKVTGIAEVAEGAAKPEIASEVSGKSLSLTKLAGWFRTTTEFNQDAPQIVAAILNQARADLTAKENQLVLTAMSNAEGVNVATGSAGAMIDVMADALGTYVGLNGVSPDYLVCAPQDLAAMRKIRAAGSGEYLVDPFGAAPSGPFGLGVKVVPGMTPGTMFMARQQAGVFFRHEAGIQLVSGYQGDDIIFNKVTTVLEERVGAAITMPQYVTKITLTA